MDDGLNLYQTMASVLSWTEYYKLLKKILHKL
jgi:hypothetical protein